MPWTKRDLADFLTEHPRFKSCKNSRIFTAAFFDKQGCVTKHGNLSSQDLFSRHAINAAKLEKKLPNNRSSNAFVISFAQTSSFHPLVRRILEGPETG
jgi:hypothetical protein